MSAPKSEISEALNRIADLRVELRNKASELEAVRARLDKLVERVAEVARGLNEHRGLIILAKELESAIRAAKGE